MAKNLQLPPGAALDWTVPQDWGAYTPTEHGTWDKLFARQSEMLPGRVVSAFMEGLDVLRMTRPGIPDFAELNVRLMAATGWQVVAVPGLVPDEIFFDHLSKRRFVADASSASRRNWTISRNPIFSMTSSGMSHCSPSQSLLIICRLMVKEACG